MLTEPDHPTRTEQADLTARTCRTERQRRADLLRELRRDPDARERLPECRAEFAKNPIPNPDRARVCRLESQRATDRYNELAANYSDSGIDDLLLDFAAEDADVWAILASHARH